MNSEKRFEYVEQMLSKFRELAEIGCTEHSIRVQLGLSEESFSFYRQILINRMEEESVPVPERA